MQYNIPSSWLGGEFVFVFRKKIFFKLTTFPLFDKNSIFKKFLNIIVVGKVSGKFRLQQKLKFDEIFAKIFSF